MMFEEPLKDNSQAEQSSMTNYEEDKLLTPRVVGDYVSFECLSLSTDIWSFGICKFLLIKDLKNLRLVSRWFYKEVVIYPIWKQKYPLEQIHEHYKLLKTLSSQQRCQALKKSNITSVFTYSSLKSIPSTGFKILRFYPIYYLNLSSSNKIIRNEHLKIKLPPYLHSLNLASCNVSDEIIPYLPSCLQILNLAETKVTDQGLKELPKALRTLNLSGCKKIDGSGIEFLPLNLQALYLDECNLNANTQQFFVKYPLVELSLKETPLLIQYQHCPKTLKELNIFCPKKQKTLDIAFPMNIQIFYESPVESTTPLLFALRSMNACNIENLIANGCNVNFSNNAGLTPLMQACFLDSNDIIFKILLKNGASVNQLNKSKESALIIAMKYSTYSIAELLLQHSPNFQNCIPLYFFSELFSITNLVEKLQLLFKYGYEVDQVDPVGNTLLMSACNLESLQFTALLLQAGANPNYINPQTNRCPLAIYSAKGNEQICQLLLDYGANVNGCEGTVSPLTLAAKNNKQAVVQLLIARGASPNCVHPEEYSPLIFLCEDGNLELVELLIKAGAEVNHQVLKNKKTALYAACEFDQYEIVQLLLSNGATITNSSTFSPLLIAVTCNHIRILELLLQQPNIKVDTLFTDENATALFLGCAKGFFNVVQLLLDKGADPNKGREKDGNTPLLISCQKGFIRQVRILLQFGADPNLKRKTDSNTPLQISILRKEIEIQELLLQYGAKN